MPGSPSVISGTVRDSAGRAVEGARISLVESPLAPLPDIALLTGADGSFSIGAPMAGTYRLACHADGFLPQSATLTVTAGTDATLDFHLR